MKNKRGYTAFERIEQDLEYVENLKDEVEQKLLMTKALGAIDFAVEFGMITYEEWEKYINRVFCIL